jgi:hypothetical protein
MPRYWYFLFALAVLTPLYFLLGRPRKRRQGSSWKG